MSVNHSTETFSPSQERMREMKRKNRKKNGRKAERDTERNNVSREETKNTAMSTVIFRALRTTHVKYCRVMINSDTIYVNRKAECQISGSHGGEYGYDSSPCNRVEIGRRFRGIYCLHHPAILSVSSYQAIRSNIPEDSCLPESRCSRSVKSGRPNCSLLLTCFSVNFEQ
jgi:hypothetical protein